MIIEDLVMSTEEIIVSNWYEHEKIVNESLEGDDFEKEMIEYYEYISSSDISTYIKG